MHIWSLLGEIQCWYLFICCCLSSLLFLCFVIFPLRENRLVLCLLDIFERSLQKFAGSRNEIQNRLNRSSGTALTSMLYNKVGVFFKVFADDCNNFLYNVCDDSLSGTWYTAGSSSGGERERERRFIRFPCKCGSSAFVLNCITLDKCWTAASLYCLIGCCFHGGSSVAELVSCNSIPSFLVSQPLQLLTTLMGSTLVPLSVVLIGAIWYWFPHWFLICFLCKKKKNSKTT